MLQKTVDHLMNRVASFCLRRGVKIGDCPSFFKVVRHAKYVTFQLAEVALSRELFAAILDRIQWYGVPPPLVRRG